MYDQAQTLREQLRNLRTSSTRIITVTSGKGGVGKSNFTLNFALGLLKRNHRTVILDADIGLGNLDVLMNLQAKHSLMEMMDYHLSINDILEEGPEGLKFIGGGSGFTELLSISEEKLAYFTDQLVRLNDYADTIIIDTGAGISKESVRFMLASDEIFVVTTPEPTAITDAYAVIKLVFSRHPRAKVRLIINRVTSANEGEITEKKLVSVVRKFLDAELDVLGYVFEDMNVSKSVKLQTPFLLAQPSCVASKSIHHLADKYLYGYVMDIKSPIGVRGFLQRIRSLLG